MADKKELSGIILIVLALFMMASKDNIKIKSQVAVINREAVMRPENFCRDASLIGVGLLLLGGLGGSMTEKMVTHPEDDEDDDE